MKFELIPVEALHKHWPVIKIGCERVREFGGVPWIPEDIYAHLRFKMAAAYFGTDDDGKYRGFFVTETKRIPHSGEMSLHVWVLHAEAVKGDHFADVKCFMDETIDFLDECARHAKATLITQDGRHGWSRFLGDTFKPTLVRFERVVI